MASITLQEFKDLTLDQYRSLAVFASYLTFNVSLTIFLSYSILSRYSVLPSTARRSISILRLAFFVLLTVASLSATWYHMFSFFAYSYHTHLSRSQPALVAADHIAALPPLARVFHALGVESLPEQRLKAVLKTSINGLPLSPKLIAEWLNQSSLFREAWESACTSPARYWWTQQIFALTAAWAVYLGWSSRRAAVAYAPLFMVLAQLVAVSFAMNLFFVAILLTPAVTDNTTEDKNPIVRKGRHIATWYAVGVTFLSIPVLPATVGTQYFPIVLAVPHLLLFLPSLGIRGNSSDVWRLFRHVYLGILAVQVASLIYVAFEIPIATWAAAMSADLTHEFYAQTGLVRALFPLDLFLKQPWPVKIRTCLEPFLAPSATLLNVIEPQLSILTGWLISSTAVTGKQFVEDPLIIVTWIADIVAFVQTKAALLERALFAHPAVSSVGLDAVLVWISGLAWILTGNGAQRALLGSS